MGTMPSSSGVHSVSYQGRAFGWLSSSLTDSGLQGMEYVHMVEGGGGKGDEKREEEAMALYKDPMRCELITVDEATV